MYFLLAPLLLAAAHLSAVSLGNAKAERLEEGIQLAIQVLFGDPQLPLKKKEQLLLHQVHLGSVESEAIHLRGDVGVVGPMLVLW
jgi:hypothetical protein